MFLHYIRKFCCCAAKPLRHLSFYNIVKYSIASIDSACIKGIASLETMTTTKSLKELGYAFNTGGQLRKLLPDGQITDQPFIFDISNDHQSCQTHYEQIGDAVTDYVYYLLESQEHLMRLPVPVGSTQDIGTFIFVSRDYDKVEKLMILIHGSGAVRAGQWARSVIINNSLEAGTQIPYIKRAVAMGFGIMILNSNDNSKPNGQAIPNSESPEEHSSYVWETYVAKTQAKTIAIVAHSFGGVVTLMLSEKYKKEFENRVKVVALTDSVHVYSNYKINEHLKKISKNWISSKSPLDTPMKTQDSDIQKVSAGHPQHEMTSHSCIDSVFKFIHEKLQYQ